MIDIDNMLLEEKFCKKSSAWSLLFHYLRLCMKVTFLKMVEEFQT